MNIHLLPAILQSILILVVFTEAVAQQDQSAGYILEIEKNIAKTEPGPHSGGGNTIGYSFFNDVEDFDYAFRKRVLKPGSSIGYHLQEKDEIYYILSGTGEMRMNDETISVEPGLAILTWPGSSHGLKPSGDEDLVIIIVYEKE